MSTHPHDDHMIGVIDAIAAFMSRSGYESRFGRTVVHEIEAAGLQDVDADGRLRVHRGGSPGTTMLRLSIESLSAALVASGALTSEDLERALATLDDPGTVFLSAAMIAAWGRKPLRSTRSPS